MSVGNYVVLGGYPRRGHKDSPPKFERPPLAGCDRSGYSGGGKCSPEAGDDPYV